jgi:hypothetical protein
MIPRGVGLTVVSSTPGNKTTVYIKPALSPLPIQQPQRQVVITVVMKKIPPLLAQIAERYIQTIAQT